MLHLEAAAPHFPTIDSCLYGYPFPSDEMVGDLEGKRRLKEDRQLRKPEGFCHWRGPINSSTMLLRHFKGNGLWQEHPVFLGSFSLSSQPAKTCVAKLKILTLYDIITAVPMTHISFGHYFSALDANI